MNECTKAAARRAQIPAFVERYFVGSGIDVGAGADGLGTLTDQFPHITACRHWDLPDGDAQYLAGVEDGTFDFLHSSHCLEHMVNPQTALHHWLRVVRPGGYLVITVPDEDLYEQGVWPSTFNPDHKNTFTVWKPRSWSPRSVSVLALVGVLDPAPEVLQVALIEDGYDWTGERRDLTHLSPAECAIEIVLRKRTAAELLAGGRLRGADHV
jgi:SAM-dependent methyltransferase